MTHELWARGRYLCNVFPSERPFDVLADEQRHEPQTILICVENGVRTVVGTQAETISSDDFEFEEGEEYDYQA